MLYVNETILHFQCNTNSSKHNQHYSCNPSVTFQDVLRAHPPNQVLLALQALASKQQVVLEEKTAALDVERDVSALGYEIYLKFLGGNCKNALLFF